MIADPRDIIIRPIVSEKSYGLLESGSYTFEVHPDANKTQVKIAIEKIFDGVKVISVNTLNRQGKRKRTRAGYGQRKVHQARHRHAVQGQQADRRLLGRLSGVREKPWVSVNTSRRPPVVVAPRWLTSPRSPATPRRSR